jgi:prepilin-type processing-associated H-X9-DG protein
VIHDNTTDRPTLPPGCTSSPLALSINNLPFASFHPSGVNFCFGDASVRFLPNDIDMKLFLALGSRNGDDMVEDDF